MILISSQQYDSSSNDVIDWLIKNKIAFFRINIADKYRFKFKNARIFINFNAQNIALDKIYAYWYRRGFIGVKRDIPRSLNFMRDYLQNENEILNQYLHFNLGIKKLNSFYNSEPNKLIVLQEAIKVGLKIPTTFIIDNKKDLLKVSKNSPLITKVLTSSCVFSFNNESGIIYTTNIDDNLIKRLPDYFFPTLFQKKIDKKYEIRSFLLKNKFWSMAIFSQSDKQTEVDYRKYNLERPNRMVSFNLPSNIEKKILKLFKILKFESGSIDFIVSTANEFFFLEINPIGQFGVLSKTCNYSIEKSIAKYLTL